MSPFYGLIGLDIIRANTPTDGDHIGEIFVLKRVSAFVLMFGLIMGSVSASSINGDFNGNPIVKLTSDGYAVPVEDTPAIIYEGRTMVPIYMLKNLGADVTWDGNTYTVDVKMPGSDSITVDTIMKVFGPSGKKHLLSFAQYMTNGADYTQVNLITN